ncbi:MAG: hypothetical protein GTO14_24935 [Anaerolineales bacterium]|nr:hypothetical protein [Anaerolineales bacterium]
MNIEKTHLRVLLLMTIVVVSCSTSPASPTATPGLAPPTSTPALPIREATPSPSPEPPAIEIPTEGKVSADGPWLVYYDFYTERLIAIDQNGQAWQSFEIPKPDNFAFFPAPSGGHLAYVSGSAFLPQPDHELVILQIPVGKIVRRISLFGPTWQEQIVEQGLETEYHMFENDVLRGLQGEGAVAWSSDGTKVAFTAAIEGPSSDLYLLDLSSGEIERLTSGPLQAYELNWSPDDAWIVHLSVDTFGTGAGWNVDTLWAAASDGSSVMRVVDNVRMTFVEAWQSETDFLATEWGADFGPQGLFRFSIEKRTREILFEGPLPALAFDGDVSTAAIFKDPMVAAYFDYVPGVYVIDLATGEQIIVEQTEEVSNSIVWVDSVEMYAATFEERTILFDRSGTLHVEISRGGLLTPSPDGSFLAIYGDRWRGEPGLAIFTTSGEELAQPASEWVFMVTWSPDSRVAFYETDASLYVLSAEDMTTTMLKKDVPDWPEAYFWIPAP